jgi:hypothetical protein
MLLPSYPGKFVLTMHRVRSKVSSGKSLRRDVEAGEVGSDNRLRFNSIVFGR